MALTIKSIIICLVILAMAPDIHTQNIGAVGSPKQLVVFENKILLFGSGVYPSQLPIIVYSPNPTSLETTIYTQPEKKCGFTFAGDGITSVGIQTINQIDDKRIIIIWSAQSEQGVTTVTLLDMDTCINKDMEFTWDLKDKIFVEAVPFVDGFDVITSKNTRESYDTDGKLTDKTDSFPINSIDFSISAASGRTRDKGYFVVDRKHAAVNLLNADGSVFKPLLNLADLQVFSNNEQSLYSVCTFNLKLNNDIDCSQYDQVGTKKWNNKVTLGFDGKLDLKNLPGGGLAIVALNGAGSQFFIVEMGSEPAKIWNYSAEQIKFKAVKLTDYNKQERTFDLAYDIFQGINGKVVALQKYSLQN